MTLLISKISAKYTNINISTIPVLLCIGVALGSWWSPIVLPARNQEGDSLEAPAIIQTERNIILKLKSPERGSKECEALTLYSLSFFIIHVHSCARRLNTDGAQMIYYSIYHLVSRAIMH
jgi:hypothetical protein